METVVEEAKHNFSQSAEFDREEREQRLEDFKFAALEQWPAALKMWREKDKNGQRPCLVLDNSGQYRRQVINDTRMNMPEIKYAPVDDKADKRTAEVLTGVVRHLQTASSADIAYLTSLDHAVTSGLGYFRIITKYSSDDSWDQDIAIARVYNPFSIYNDPSSTEPDGSDSEWCVIPQDVKRKDFEKLYPGAEMVSSFEGVAGDTNDSWWGEHDMRVAEYFRIVREKDEVLLLEDNSTMYGSRYQELREKGHSLALVTRTRKVDRRVCEWYKVTGAEILERSIFPASFIPVIPVIGSEFWIEGKRILHGLIRPLKDPQRGFNYAASVALEVSALQPRAPYIGAAGQFKGYETKWDKANSENYSRLEYNPITVAGVVLSAPTRTQFGGVPPALLQQMQFFQASIQSALGMYQASVGAPSNERSGIAIEARQREGDVGNVHYRYSLQLALRHAGRIMLQMIPVVWDTPRVQRLIGEDGDVDTVRLDPKLPVPMHETPPGQPNIYNITGKYDVTVVVGPAYSTRRRESAEAMLEWAAKSPEIMQIAGDLIARSQDWPGADKFADRLAKAVPPQFQDEEDGQPQIPPQVQQQVQQMRQQLQQAGQMMQQLQAELEKAESDGLDAQTKKAEIEIKENELVLKRMELDIKLLEAQAKAGEVQARTDKTQAETAHIAAPNELMSIMMQAASVMSEAAASLSASVANTVTAKEVKVSRDPSGKLRSLMVVPAIRERDGRCRPDPDSNL